MINQDDIIYFVVTDRFYDGDPSNNAGVDKTNPRKFHGGDLKGILDKLDYIVNLGATALWITPVYQNVTDFYGDNPYHYYWPKDFTRIDDHLFSPIKNYPAGDKRYLKYFVQTCHSKNIKVILDVVVNHAGYGVKESGVFPADWFSGDFDGLPEFNLNNPDVVDYFINNLIDWIDNTGIDGLRMDMAKDIPAKFWYYYKSIIKGRFPGIFIVGEVLDFNVRSDSTFQDEYDLNSIFDFPLQNATVKVFIEDNSFLRIARKRLSDNETPGILDMDDPASGGYYTNSNRLVTLLDNHDLDTGRILSWARQFHPGEGNNKAMSFSIIEMCYAFQMTVRGIPQIYYGSEIGLEGWANNSANNNNTDSDLRRDFPWEKIDTSNNVGNGYPLEQHLFGSVKKLIALRRNSSALKYGVTLTLWVDDFVYAFMRYYQKEIMILIFNNGYLPMPSPLNIPIIRNTDKTAQVIPDTIIDLLESKSLVNAFDNTDKYQVSKGVLSVAVSGKAYKILRS